MLGNLKFNKNYTISSASYFNFGGLEFCLRLAIPISLQREILRLVFPISLRLVLNQNVGIIVAFLSLFP